MKGNISSPKFKNQVHKEFVSASNCTVCINVLIASHEAVFAGNIDDCFRLGVSVKRNAINLYAKFYSADLIIASPLGLRTIIGAKGSALRTVNKFLLT